LLLVVVVVECKVEMAAMAAQVEVEAKQALLGVLEHTGRVILVEQEVHINILHPKAVQVVAAVAQAEAEHQEQEPDQELVWGALLQQALAAQD
jgi:hypothetical protein